MAEPSRKGQDGEIRVALDIATLDRSTYHAVHNVTVLVSDGTTQIDHVVVSKYGLRRRNQELRRLDIRQGTRTKLDP
jgi:hypothetical protein